MSTEQKTTSLKLSQALKEAGAKQESEKIHMLTDKAFGRYELCNNMGLASYYEGAFASFDCHELLERLLFRIVVKHDELIEDTSFDLAMLKYGDGEVSFAYRDPFTTGGLTGGYLLKRGTISPKAYFRDKVPAEALGKLYLWCLENGHVEKAEGGS